MPHLQSGQDSLPVTRRAAQRGRLPSAASPQLIGQLAFLDAPDRLSVLMVYNVEVDGSDGVSELFCLATTLLDHQAYPAEAVVAAYPQRWSASETTIGENTRPPSGTSNPRRAQLVFNSHDATVLGDSVGDRLIGRDQVWFTEKHSDGSTRLYPLADLDPRKEEAIGRRYLAGRYGARPILSRQEFDATAELITSGDRS